MTILLTILIGAAAVPAMATASPAARPRAELTTGPCGESSPKLFGHGRVSKKKWTPLLLFIERKFPLNVLLADSGVQMGVSQIHPLLGGAHR